MSQTAILILAAGHGTRMKSELPKVMHKLHGKPMIGHVVDAMISSGLDPKPTVVVSPSSDVIRDYLGERVSYAVQDKQLGTGHAVQSAQSVIGDADHIIVINGDLPLLSAEAVMQLGSAHLASPERPITMFTTTVPNFEAPFAAFFRFGRIIRDGAGAVIAIREMKDCSDDEKEIQELNTGLYCFDAPWLWTHLKEIKNNNAQGEYYLTDLISLAIHEGKHIETVALSPEQSFGVNSQEDLVEAHKFVK